MSTAHVAITAAPAAKKAPGIKSSMVSERPCGTAQVARFPSGALFQRKCACGANTGSSGSCDDCERKRQREAIEGEESRASSKPPIQRHRVEGSPAPDEVPPQVDAALSAPGHPLDAASRQYFEPRFGHDFSRVRVHVDDAATGSVAARAFTVGERIVFASNEYRPTSDAGKRLLAHELTHVVQQKQGISLQGRVGDADDNYERQADAVADRVVSGRSAASFLPSGSHPSTNNTAVSGTTRSVQRAPGLLPPQKVQEAYGYWVQEFFRSRGTTVMTEALDKEVRERVKKAVGPTNFANWERWEQVQDAKIDAQAEADNPKPEKTKPFSPQAELPTDHDKMWESTKKLRAEIVQTEYLAQKLNFGGGVKGSAARITAGGYTAMWGIGARTVNSAAEHAPMLVLSGVATVFGSELGERTLINQGRAVAQEAREMDDDSQTAVRLVAGDLQAAYDATRPAYSKYQKAFSDFTDASTKFKKDLQLDGIDGYPAQASDIGVMRTAMKAMGEAGNEYLMACAKMGIQTEAQALDTLGGHIVKGSQEAVGTAVMFALPELAPGVGELKGAVKGAIKSVAKGAEGTGARLLEKEAAAQVAASIAKTEEKTVIGGARQAATHTGEDAALKRGMPHGSEPPASAARAEATAEGGSAAHASEDAAAGSAKELKPPPEAEAKQLKQLSKDKDAVKPVSDATLSKDYDLEIEVNAGGEKHTYRRKQSDGSWCRFSKRDCGYQFDPEDQEAINRMAAGEFSRSAGWAIEDYTTSLGYSKPREGNFPGIDAWKGGREIPKGTAGSVVDRVVGADVVQVKAMNSLKLSDVIRQYNTGIKGLVKDSWGTSKLIVSKPKSRTLLMVFDEATYSRLSLGQEMELKKLIKTMTEIATKNEEPIVVKWAQFIGGKMRPIL